MKKVPLTQGKFALVDDEDYERVMLSKWHAKKSHNLWYATARFGKNQLDMHRFILNVKPDEECDHINGDGLDNRKCNLRIVTHQQNIFNQRKQLGRSSRFKGVCWEKRRSKWIVHIMFNQKTIFIGYFTDEVEAARAYDDMARECFGEYARLNFNRGSE